MHPQPELESLETPEALSALIFADIFKTMPLVTWKRAELVGMLEHFQISADITEELIQDHISSGKLLVLDEEHVIPKDAVRSVIQDICSPEDDQWSARGPSEIFVTACRKIRVAHEDADILYFNQLGASWHSGFPLEALYNLVKTTIDEMIQEAEIIYMGTSYWRRPIVQEISSPKLPTLEDMIDMMRSRLEKQVALEQGHRAEMAPLLAILPKPVKKIQGTLAIQGISRKICELRVLGANSDNPKTL